MDNHCVHLRGPDGNPTGRPLFSGSEANAAAFIRARQNGPDSLVLISADASNAIVAALTPENDPQAAPQEAAEQQPAPDTQQQDAAPGDQSPAP